MQPKKLKLSYKLDNSKNASSYNNTKMQQQQPQQHQLFLIAKKFNKTLFLKWLYSLLAPFWKWFPQYQNQVCDYVGYILYIFEVK